MKRITALLLLFVLASNLFAGTVTDRSNMLTQTELSNLQSELASLPVWIETMNSVPGDDIARYANNRIKELTSAPGFIVVATTHPRAWRISMNPTGFVGGEATRQIGDAMAAQFRQGRFYFGFKTAAQNLSNLSTPADLNVQPTRQVERVEKPAPVQRPTEIQSTVSGTKSRKNNTMLLLAIGAVLLVISVIGFSIHSELKRSNAATSSYGTPSPKPATPTPSKVELKPMSYSIGPSKPTLPEIKQAASKTSTPVAKKKTLAEIENQEAMKVWNSYPTAKSRKNAARRYASKYPDQYQTGSVLNDPLTFYMYMNAVAPHNMYFSTPSSEPYSYSNGYSSGASYSETKKSRSSSDDSYKSSTWDSSGGGGSWGDSSGGFSSSDSGGSDGSW